MTNQFLPQTALGKWSVCLHSIFAVAVILAVTLALGLKVLSFGDTWWDISVPILLALSIAALVLAILARTKFRDHSVSVMLSLLLGILVIIFTLTHSLFISD